MDICILCDGPIDLTLASSYSILTEKGVNSINNASEQRSKVEDFQYKPFTYSENQNTYVHQMCRKKHTDLRKIGKKRSHSAAPCLRSKGLFDFRNQCLYCANIIDKDKARKYKDQENVQYSSVMALKVQGQVEEVWKDIRKKDSWSTEVKCRLDSCIDLPAAEAVYHRVCMRAFYKNRCKPDMYAAHHSEPQMKKTKTLSNTKRGRPKDPTKQEAFSFAVDYLEKFDDGTITLQELQLFMKMRGWGEDVYSERQLKSELTEYFGDKISITSYRSKANIVTLTENVKSILQEVHEQSKSCDASAEDIIKSAARIIRSEIKSMPNYQEKDTYPNLEDMSSLSHNTHYLPPSLRQLLSSILKSRHSELHTASIGQAIMLCTCPRSFLPPIPLALGITIQHRYGHRQLGDLLHKLGFITSYTEASDFRRCAAAEQATGFAFSEEDALLQFMADNVDHDTETVEGKGTVHMMGMMACVTPAVPSKSVIKRQKISNQELVEIGKINIYPQPREPSACYPKVIYTKVGPFTSSEDTMRLNTLYSVSHHFTHLRIPSWSGQMQLLHSDQHYPGRSSEHFLPMLDLQPSDPTCVRSTLEYISTLARCYNVSPIVTFDQQLWWIAYFIIEGVPSTHELRKIVLILGGFHAQASFCGTIGSIMNGSGLREAIANVYAEGSIDKMLNGKSIAREPGRIF